MDCLSRRLHLLSRSRQMTFTRSSFKFSFGLSREVTLNGHGRVAFCFRQWRWLVGFSLTQVQNIHEPKWCSATSLWRRRQQQVHDFVRNWERPKNAASGMGGRQSAVRTNKPSMKRIVANMGLPCSFADKAKTRRTSDPGEGNVTGVSRILHTPQQLVELRRRVP